MKKNDWVTMGHALKSDTEILCPVPWLMLERDVENYRTCKVEIQKQLASGGRGEGK